ncbi:glycosyltransferase [Microbacterium sp. C5A9]|uniref:glycosyltransferase n=1 Tax=Microbacterium sp. C5A9 TaxID=2736663 RepID=UPI001F5165D5|nr:glycosyltransferase [Microbacterium sp. C5A9]
MSAVEAPAIAPLSVEHLAALTTSNGVHEHALLREPRLEHGYCTDDAARALTAVVREPVHSPGLALLASAYLDLLESAVSASGAVRNRRTEAGEWTDEPSTGDWWGRAIGGLGATARYSPDPGHRSRALRAFLRAAARSSADVRASAFAAVGAADVLVALPDATAARMLLIDCLARIPRVADGGSGWPETTLRYANGALCEALIAGGDALGRHETRDEGLRMLAGLIAVETSPHGHLSVTGSSGRSAGEAGPLWDQQPIEPAAIADACARALDVTGDRR